VAEIHRFAHASINTPGADAAPRPRLRWPFRRRTVAADPSELPVAGDAQAMFVTRDNNEHRTDIERHYRIAIRAARKEVLIANAYFFPGYRLLRDLRRAARRGVQVDLILQGQPDMPWVRRATMLLYELLVRAGVHIHEFVERPLHAKVAVIDDEWATVGSSNLDPTSLSLNLEANVMVRDQAFARELRQALDGLIQNKCETVNLPRPGPLFSAWLAVRTTVVYHVLRRFPAWVSWTQSRPPRVVPLQAETP
jgi:cardiolipin synthase